MDLSGAMPRSAWVEIRGSEGELLVSVPAEIRGGAVTAELPAFAAGTLGTIHLCTDEDGTIDRTPEELEELPTEKLIYLAQLG